MTERRCIYPATLRVLQEMVAQNDHLGARVLIAEDLINGEKGTFHPLAKAYKGAQLLNGYFGHSTPQLTGLVEKLDVKLRFVLQEQYGADRWREIWGCL